MIANYALFYGGLSFIRVGVVKCREMVILWAHNPKVRGSNPLPATKNKIKGLRFIRSPFLLSNAGIPRNAPQKIKKAPRHKAFVWAARRF